MTRTKRKRIIKYDDNGVELLDCNICLEWKPTTDFYTAKRNNSVYFFPYCKKCEIEKQHRRYEENVKIDMDKVLVEIFDKMGYETENPNNPIHKQFNKKWGL